MKRIIISRKGFDSSAGGAPSPIMADGRIFSLPIPQREKSPYRYKDLRFDEFKGTDLLKKSGSKLSPNDFCHFDPILNKAIGIFGQANAAQSELDNLDVQKGDLFLFFGWFRNCGEKAVNLHHLFGWLQIEKILKGEKNIKEFLEQKKLNHPHGFKDVSRYKNNTLYVASKKLNFRNRKLKKKGFGLFKETHEDLVLTEKNKTRSNWQLPNSFANGKNLFMNRLKWSDSKSLKLNYKGFGQEFVLNVEANPKIAKWAVKLIQSHG